MSPSFSPFSFEPHAYLGLYACIQPGDTVFDVGASYGVMTTLAAHLAGRAGRVWSFEPNPEVQAYGRMLADCQSGAAPITFINALVGETENPRVEFFAVPGLHSVASTRNPDIALFHKDAQRLHLPMVALDSLDAPPPQVIKIDVEGGEYQVLRGARSLLDAHHPDLILETHALEINGIAGNLGLVCDLLAELGYGLWDLMGNVPSDPATYASTHALTIGYLLASHRLQDPEVLRRLQ